MKRSVLFFTAVAVVVSFGSMSAFAQRGGGGGGRSGGGMGGNSGMSGNNQNGNQQQRSSKNGNSTISTKASSDLQKNPALTKRLEALLDGTDAQTASRGFASVGDLMAAAHAAKNLNLPFNTLKKQVTGSKKVSLDKAIVLTKSSITPDDAKAAAKTAKTQGDTDVKEAKVENKTAKTSTAKS